MPAITLWNVAKVWGQQCGPDRPGVQLNTPNGWVDGKTGFQYGAGTWCVSYDNGVGTPTPNPIPQGVTPPPSVSDRACGGCKQKIVAPVSPPGTVSAPRPLAKIGYPWWVFVLIALTLAQLVRGSRGRND